MSKVKFTLTCHR